MPRLTNKCVKIWNIFISYVYHFKNYSIYYIKKCRYHLYFGILELIGYFILETISPKSSRREGMKIKHLENKC